METHFEYVLNNVTTDVNMENKKECVNNTGNLCNDNDIHITYCMGQNAIDKLEFGKARGNDRLSAKTLYMQIGA